MMQAAVKNVWALGREGSSLSVCLIQDSAAEHQSMENVSDAMALWKQTTSIAGERGTGVAGYLRSYSVRVRMAGLPRHGQHGPSSRDPFARRSALLSI